VLDLTFYDNTNATGFSGNKVNQLINTQSAVPLSCYSDTLLSAENQVNSPNEVIVYITPNSELLTAYSPENINSITIFTIDGNLIGKFNNPQITNKFSIPIHQYATGIYLLIISTNQGNYSKKTIIRR
jgi:hypothetical protein